MLLFRKAKRPVKMVMSRDEVFRATGPASGSKLRVKLGFSKDGKITSGTARIVFENGAYPQPPAMCSAWCVFAPYKVTDFQVEDLDMVVNKPVSCAYRAPSSPQPAFPTEILLDQAARDLEMDPIEIRMLNAAEEGDQRVEGPVYGPIGMKATLEAIRNHPNYKIPLGPNQGRGIASGFWFNIAESSSAIVNLTEKGRG